MFKEPAPIWYLAEHYTPENAPQGMRQYAPFPYELLDVVMNAKYPPEIDEAYLIDAERDHPGVHSGGAGGLSLILHVVSPDAYKDRAREVNHLFPVPAATFNRDAWSRWLFDRIADMRMHELMEYYQVDGIKPFQPLHGPGDNPYVVHVASTDLQRRTAYTGVVKDA